MTDARPLERQWLVLRALSARRFGASVRELADDFSVSQKSIRRDLTDLRNVGFPLIETEERHGRKRWRIDRAHFDDVLGFTLTEVMSLYAARRLLEPLAGTHFWDGAQSAFRKIKAALGECALDYLARVAVVFHATSIGHSDYGRQAELIDSLMLGCEEHRITFITYQSMRSTEPVTYEVYPYGIVFHRNSLYVIAHSVNHSEVRHFKIDRISDVEIQSLRFNKPADFNLQQHLADSFGIYRGDGKPHRIRIRFTPEVARYVEEYRWHDSQKLQRQRDGSLLFEVTLGDTAEIAKWILSFGANAVVLEPKSLAGEIRDEARRILDSYRAQEQRAAK